MILHEGKRRLQKILLNGETYPWLTYDEQQQLNMCDFIRNNHNTVAVSNRIFEMLLYTHFIGESNKNEEKELRMTATLDAKEATV